MSECAGVTGEQNAWLVVSREIEDQLLRLFAGMGDGFYGTITVELKCQASVVEHYSIEHKQTFKPGEERRKMERRTGLRDGEDRRKPPP